VKQEEKTYRSFMEDSLSGPARFDYVIYDRREQESRGPKGGIPAIYSVKNTRTGGGRRGRPIVFETKIDGENGNVYLENFHDGFLGGVEQSLLYSIPDSPTFSVIDLNSAHHFSYILAKKALSPYPDKYRIIVNVDQHLDFDGSDRYSGLTGLRDGWKKTYRSKRPGPKEACRLISCGNWGMRAINFGCDKTSARCTLEPAANAYLSLGGGEDPKTKNTSVLRQATSPQALEFMTTQHASIYSTPIHVLMESVGHAIRDTNFSFKWSDAAVYLTFDRDVTIFNGTKYKDGAFSPKLIHARIASLFDFFNKRGTVVAGVDVIGLPEMPDNSRAYMHLISKTLRDYRKSAEAESWSRWVKGLLNGADYRKTLRQVRKLYYGAIVNELDLEPYKAQMQEIALLWAQTRENIRSVHSEYKKTVDRYKIVKYRGANRFEV
jgi:hypothetical protein